jgi:hypothetical protein
MHSVALRRASALAARPIPLVSSSLPQPVSKLAHSRLVAAPEHRPLLCNRKTGYEPFVALIFRLKEPYLSPLAASEVSSILESRIAGTSLGGDVQETGRVLSQSIFHDTIFSSFITIFLQPLVMVLLVFMVCSTFDAPTRVADAYILTVIGLRNVQGMCVFIVF